MNIRKRCLAWVNSWLCDTEKCGYILKSPDADAKRSGLLNFWTLSIVRYSKEHNISRNWIFRTLDGGEVPPPKKNPTEKQSCTSSKKDKYPISYDVLPAVMKNIIIFRDVILCVLVEVHRRFVGTYYFFLQGTKIWASKQQHQYSASCLLFVSNCTVSHPWR
jgi:hypothetical protein